MEYLINIPIRIDHQLIEDMLDAAGYGISYWAKQAWIGDDSNYTVQYEGDEHGFIRTSTVTFGRIAEAMSLILNDKVPNLAPDPDLADALREGDAGLIDAALADVIVQVAVFDGEVIYG